MSIGDLFFWLILLTAAEYTEICLGIKLSESFRCVVQSTKTGCLCSVESKCDPFCKFVRGRLFVDTNDTIYVVDQINNRTLIWFNNSIKPTRTIYGDMSKPVCIFVTTNGDMYISDYTTSNQTDVNVLINCRSKL